MRAKEILCCWAKEAQITRRPPQNEALGFRGFRFAGCKSLTLRDLGSETSRQPPDRDFDTGKRWGGANAQIQTHDSPRSRSITQMPFGQPLPTLNHLTASEH